MLWPAELAEAVGKCRLFLAIYCDDYFRSSFCQWELQLAIVRDPIAQKRVLLPVAVEQVALPAYCSLIQAHRLPSSGVAQEIARLVEGALLR